MDTATITLLLQILVQFGPDVYKLAVGLFAKPTPVVPADFDALTDIINRPLHS
jgi:hypothetical protein